MFIGDGAKLVRDAFNLAKEKAPAIIFIDELDAIGTKVLGVHCHVKNSADINRLCVGLDGFLVRVFNVRLKRRAIESALAIINRGNHTVESRAMSDDRVFYAH